MRSPARSRARSAGREGDRLHPRGHAAADHGRPPRARPARAHERAVCRPRSAEDSPLAIICGGGSLPFAVADAAAQARPPCRAVCHSRLGGPATRRRLSASLDGVRPVRPVLPAGAPGGLPRRGAHRLGGAAGDLADPAGFRDTPRCCRGSSRLFRGGDDHLLSGIAQNLRGARLPAYRRARDRAGNPDAGRSARPRAAERSRPRRYRQGACACSTRPAHSMSAKPWSWPTSACWRSRRRKAPTRCSRASRSCAAAGE